MAGGNLPRHGQLSNLPCDLRRQFLVDLCVGVDDTQGLMAKRRLRSVSPDDLPDVRCGRVAELVGVPVGDQLGLSPVTPRHFNYFAICGLYRVSDGLAVGIGRETVPRSSNERARTFRSGYLRRLDF